jgi:hypothetical protein
MNRWCVVQGLTPNPRSCRRCSTNSRSSISKALTEAADYPLKKRLFRNEAIQRCIGAGEHIAKSCVMGVCRTGASTSTQPSFCSCQEAEHRVQKLVADPADVAT